MKCDQDLCLKLWYDLKKLLWQDELNPRVRCAFGNVYYITQFDLIVILEIWWQEIPCRLEVGHNTQRFI